MSRKGEKTAPGFDGQHCAGNDAVGSLESLLSILTDPLFGTNAYDDDEDEGGYMADVNDPYKVDIDALLPHPLPIKGSNFVLLADRGTRALGRISNPHWVTPSSLTELEIGTYTVTFLAGKKLVPQIVECVTEIRAPLSMVQPDICKNEHPASTAELDLPSTHPMAFFAISNFIFQHFFKSLSAFDERRYTILHLDMLYQILLADPSEFDSSRVHTGDNSCQIETAE